MNRSVAEVANLFRANPPGGLNFPADVYPGYSGLVVRTDGTERIVQSMVWGFPLVLADARKRAEAAGKIAKPRPVNNARDDKLRSPMWRHWFETPAQRCLIPFDRFAEAVGDPGKMTRSWFSVKDQDCPAWAGLWRPSDAWGECYTGVMVDATPEYFHIHDRMPVILPADAHETWLRADADEAMALVKPYPASEMEVEATNDLWAQTRARKGPEKPEIA